MEWREGRVDGPSPIPRLGRSHLAAWIYFTGTDPRSHVRLAGAYTGVKRKYPLAPRCTPATFLHWIKCEPAGLPVPAQDRIGLLCYISAHINLVVSQYQSVTLTKTELQGL